MWNKPLNTLTMYLTGLWFRNNSFDPTSATRGCTFNSKSSLPMVTSFQSARSPLVKLKVCCWFSTYLSLALWSEYTKLRSIIYISKFRLQNCTGRPAISCICSKYHTCMFKIKHFIFICMLKSYIFLQFLVYQLHMSFKIVNILVPSPSYFLLLKRLVYTFINWFFIHINIYEIHAHFDRFRKCVYNTLKNMLDHYIIQPFLHVPDSKVHEANMGPTWVLSAPDGPHVGPGTLLSGVLFMHAYLTK